MEDLLPIIKSRRNIQEFLPKPVDWDKVSRIIDAGRHAPSSGNLQDWKFIVVMDQDKKHEIAEISMEQYEIAVAPVLIVVCSEPEKVERYYGLRGRNLFSIQNCAAAVQNMLLEAYSLGLGTRWVGAFDEDRLKATLGIPEEARAQAIVAIGYPKYVPEKPPRYPLELMTYFGKWRARVRDPDKYFGNYSAIVARNLKGIKTNVEEAGKFVAEKSVPAAKSLAEKAKEVVKNLRKKDEEDEGEEW
ncbi:MAG: nitroreductase family protein [archaeon]|nr:nitroreductase family protein [Nanoarchaeota archaeon]